MLLLLLFICFFFLLLCICCAWIVRPGSWANPLLFVYLVLSSGVYHFLNNSKGPVDKKLHFPENNCSDGILIIVFSPSLSIVLSLCSGVRACTLWLRGSGGWGTLLFRGSCDPLVEPWHSDRWRLLGGGAERAGGRFPLRVGRRSYREWRDQRGRGRWHTGTVTPVHTWINLTDNIQVILGNRTYSRPEWDIWSYQCFLRGKIPKTVCSRLCQFIPLSLPPFLLVVHLIYQQVRVQKQCIRTAVFVQHSDKKPALQSQKRGLICATECCPIRGSAAGRIWPLPSYKPVDITRNPTSFKCYAGNVG